MLLNSEKLEAIDLLLQKFRRPAIMLHRPYPPINLPPMRSRLGGLPQLADAFEWPRGLGFGPSIMPLHFLAQIDCAELPRVDPRMPSEGMLFFFGRDDAEQLWGDTKPEDDARVIYAPNVPEQQRERPAPADLRPIRDSEPGPFRMRYFRPDWLLPEESGPAVHAGWPLVALRIDSWPDASAIYETPSFLELVSRAAHAPERNENRAVAAFVRERPSPTDLDRRVHEAQNQLLELYTRRVTAARVGAVAAATGLPTRTEASPVWGAGIGFDRFILPRDWSQGSKPFPQLGIMIDRIARYLVREALVRIAHREYQEPKRQKSLAGIETAARHWVRRAQEIGLDAVPPEADAAAFRTWLNELAHGDRPEMRYAFARVLEFHRDANPPEAVTTWLNELTRGDSPEMRYELGDIFKQALLSSIAYAAHSPHVAALIPPDFYEMLENHHLPFEQSGEGGRGRAYFGPSECRVSTRFHQMLGHVPCAQEAASYADADVPLLQLCDDDQIDMSFGDVGAATFWIKPADLAGRRFEKAWGEIVGH